GRVFRLPSLVILEGLSDASCSGIVRLSDLSNDAGEDAGFAQDRQGEAGHALWTLQIAHGRCQRTADQSDQAVGFPGESSVENHSGTEISRPEGYPLLCLDRCHKPIL